MHGSSTERDSVRSEKKTKLACPRKGWERNCSTCGQDNAISAWFNSVAVMVTVVVVHAVQGGDEVGS